MSHPKHATPDHPILEPMVKRWSPYAFDATRSVSLEHLRICLEAARWAASSYNEQPWTFLLARREDKEDFDTMLGCLVEGNQAWAKFASVLLITVVQRSFKLNGKPNKAAEHDIGLAAGNLVIQAAALGIDSHQMIGILPDKVRATYGVPEGYDPLTGIALGYAADPATFPDQGLASRDTNPRSRKAFDEFVFAGGWNNVAKL